MRIAPGRHAGQAAPTKPRAFPKTRRPNPGGLRTPPLPPRMLPCPAWPCRPARRWREITAPAPHRLAKRRRERRLSSDDEKPTRMLLIGTTAVSGRCGQFRKTPLPVLDIIHNTIKPLCELFGTIPSRLHRGEFSIRRTPRRGVGQTFERAPHSLQMAFHLTPTMIHMIYPRLHRPKFFQYQTPFLPRHIIQRGQQLIYSLFN